MSKEEEKDCIFCQITEGKTGTPFIYSDDSIVAFEDIDPQAPVHLLIVPRKHIRNLNLADDSVTALCMHAVRKLAEEYNISESGYRVVVNCNRMGGQEVDHLHFHLLGGRQMKWPPG